MCRCLGHLAPRVLLARVSPRTLRLGRLAVKRMVAQGLLSRRFVAVIRVLDLVLLSRRLGHLVVKGPFLD